MRWRWLKPVVDQRLEPWADRRLLDFGWQFWAVFALALTVDSVVFAIEVFSWLLVIVVVAATVEIGWLLGLAIADWAGW
jgi:hypothetical protein